MANENEVAFAPKGDVKGVGGSFALPGGKTFDIGKRLKSQTGGSNRIVTSDPAEIEGLRRCEALKEVPTRARSKKTAAKAKPAASSSGPAESTTTTDNGGEG